MTQDQMAQVMEQIFGRCQALRGAGQKEYAHLQENAFRNFEDVGKYTGISREQCLLVYLRKHIDGISAYVKGHKSQREDVRGRICDAIVYLCLLYGMVDETVEKSDYKEVAGTVHAGFSGSPR